MAKFQASAALLLIAIAAVATADSVDNAEDCPTICPALFAPVCAYNGKIYKEFVNPCMLKDSNCELKKRSIAATFVKVFDEWCSSEFVENLYEKLHKPDSITPECMNACPMLLDPICISNGVYRGLVSNECEMQSFNKCLGDKIKPFKLLRRETC